MHISKIYIKNFKCIEELSIDTNDSFNVIIGENNQGKSTIFEAMQFWYRCYQRYIQTNKKEFYSGDNLYIPYRDLNFLRFWKDTDLFNKSPYESIIGLTLVYQENKYNLSFKINRPKAIADSYIRVSKRNKDIFKRYAESMKSNSIRLNEAIFLYETTPISRVLSHEPFMTKGQVNKKIMIGKSRDVLRNKIVKHKDLETLSAQVSDVMGRTIEFQYVNKRRQDNEEYIDLQVKDGPKKNELHLQGSGLLQIVEIFGTLDYVAAEMNILLIDEPDSHIHLVLQKKLMSSLRSLNNNQTFIISHNDAFVSECQDGELFYLNQEAKIQKELLALEDFDLIKKDFGSPILAFQRLNQADTVVFTEGSDDINNIKELLKQYQLAGLIGPNEAPSSCHFFHIRGKDKLIEKMDHNRRTLSQLFRDKKYVVITDKDFTTLSNSDALNAGIERKLGQNSIAFSHDGYCLESTLFSDLDNLYLYISELTNKGFQKIKTTAETYLTQLKSDLVNLTSLEYKNMKQKFISQKNNRDELSNTEFDDVMEDVTQSIDDLRYIMNKGQIRKFIEHIEGTEQVSIVNLTPGEESDDDFCSTLFQDYCKSIPNYKITFQDHKELLSRVYNIQIS